MWTLWTKVVEVRCDWQRDGAPVQLGQRKALRQDEDMSAPLTTREALAEARCPCGDAIQKHAPLGCTWCLGCRLDWPDALLASGALVDATKLADHLGFICDEWVTTQASRPEAHGVARGMAAEIRTALAAALLAQSERAEVER